LPQNDTKFRVIIAAHYLALVLHSIRENDDIAKCTEISDESRKTNWQVMVEFHSANQSLWKSSEGDEAANGF
jgi:hypothetical protein